MRDKIEGLQEIPLIYRGEEEELYDGEIKSVILDILNESKKTLKKNSRRENLVEDILNSNEFQNRQEEKRNDIKRLLKGYKNMSKSLRNSLENFGFEIASEGKHYKLTYYGDSRYVVSYKCLLSGIGS